MAKPLMSFLATIEVEGEIVQKVIDERSFSIGRSLEATLAFSSPNISRIHLIVTHKHDNIYIEDQASANGTFVNGSKIAEKKSFAVSPQDKIKLGTSDIVISFLLLEKCFNQEDYKKSRLPSEEKDDLIRLIKGAHGEAARVMKLAQEQHDMLVRKGEAKASAIENNMLLKKDEALAAANVEASQIIQEAHKKTAQIIFDGEEKAERSVQNIYSQADAIKAEAERYYHQKVDEAEAKGNEIINAQKDAGQVILQEARDKMQLMREQHAAELEQLKTRAQAEANEIIRLANEKAEKTKIELIDQVKKETQNEVDELIQKAEIFAQEEKQKLISAAESSAQTLIDNARKEESGYLARIEELKKSKIELEAELLEQQNKKHIVDATMSSAQAELSRTQDLVQQQTKENNLLRDNLAQLKLDKGTIEKEKETFVRELQQLQQQKQTVHIDIEHQKAKLQEMISEFEAKKIELKTKLDDDFAKQTKYEEEKINALKLSGLENAKKTQQDFIDGLYLHKEKLTNDIIHHFENQTAQFFKNGEWVELKNTLTPSISQIIEQKALSLTTAIHANQDIKLLQPQKKKFINNIYWSGVGVALTIIAIFSYQFLVNKVSMDENSIEIASKKYAESVKEDLERRKFNPPQVYEIKETYTDSVIYTHYYSEVYLDNEVQQRWNRAAVDYLLKKWRVDEDKAIQVLSSLNTLVNNLEEKRKVIHPDFIQQDIQKMHAYENETVARVVENLGTNVKYQALKGFEKKFFEDEIAKKIAQNKPVSN